jgi:phage gpG-like protein
MSLAEIENNLKRFVDTAKPKILNVIAIECERTIKRNFEAGGRPAWAPRKRISKRQKGTNILVISGALKNYHCVADTGSSLVRAIADPRARAYARIHNEGGVINIPSRAVKLRKNKSGRTVFASSRHKRIVKETQTKAYEITIPKREHTNIPAEDLPRWYNSIKQALQL